MKWLHPSIWLKITLLLLISTFSLDAQSIAEKKANLSSGSSGLDPDTEKFLLQVNRETLELRLEINHLYDQVWDLYLADAPSYEYESLLETINEDRKQVRRLEIAWRELASSGNVKDEYGLWHAPETTLEQLVIDYGSQDYVYLIPADVGSIRLSVNSNLPIPRSAWNEMLELILNQNGVGIRSLNPYLRQLYFLQQDHSNIAMITNQREDLELLPSDARVTFVISPEPSEVRRAYLFLEKFINPTTTILQTLGRDILLIAQNSEIQDLLKLYDFVAKNRGDKEYRLVPVHKAKVEEMAKILAAMFDQTVESSQSTYSNEIATMKAGAATTKPGFSETNGLKVVLLESMSQALFLVGTKEELHKAEEIIHNVENRIGGARDRVVFFYSVRHSDPEDLADVLSKVYSLMMATGAGTTHEDQQGNGKPGQAPLNVNNETINVSQKGPDIVAQPLVNQLEPPLSLYGPEGFYQEGAYVYNPAPVQPGVLLEREPNQNRDNFIVDLKTSSMVMVVEADVLPKIKELLKKLDVPKKMVHIETMLFEKRLRKDSHYGLNLLRFGDYATNTHATGGFFNDLAQVPIPGLFQFLISRKESDNGTPAFDMIYRFLMSQDDVQINSTPSIMTVNQTPAQIAILDEISVSTGIFVVDTAKGNSLKDAFTRSQYGITLVITPSIHLREENDENSEDDFDYVTLDADITFDTIESDINNRPNVIRRHLVNQVQIQDGQAVILGGLRKKNIHDIKQGIPFIGEVPYLGKFFSETDLHDESSEMFIFITPHIIKDPATELDRLRQELLCLRPGDEPYFLKSVEDAHRLEKNRLMQGSMKILFGRPRPNYYVPIGEYDGCGIDDCIPY